jgi:S1-C subfamily serine protease
MNIIDLLIVCMALGALARGYRIGMTRQAGSTLGFIIGLLAGSWFSAMLVAHESSSISKSLTSLFLVLLGGLVGTTVGEFAGLQLKTKLMQKHSLDTFDGGLGSVMAAITVLFAIWLGASILVLGPSSGFQQVLKSSRILSSLDSHLPPATSLLSSLNKLVDPNGFPEVFNGLEPSPSSTNLPSLGSLNPAVAATKVSVVKVEGTGCGGIVEGSGFVIASDKIVTNAHVIAGVASPKVIDGNGLHNTRVVWFDPNVDVAVLQVKNLAGKPLRINSSEQPSGTPGAALGYPGGGNFTAQPAAVISHFTAYGRNIYGQSTSVRDIYSLNAHIIPGNSGGPLVASDGQVLGIVFATSTTYNNVGYALTGHQVAGELASAEQSTTTYTTGSCSE